MSVQLKIFSIVVSLAFLILIVELVRARKLREEYSAVYLVTGAAILLLVLRFELLVKITRFLDAAIPASVLFLFGLLFLLVMSLQYAVRFSHLTRDVKNLAQKIALMDAEMRLMGQQAGSPPGQEIGPGDIAAARGGGG